jgi:hypothetical protein
VTNEASDPSNHTAPPETRKNKLPYQKPAFRYEGVFETTALACGKISTTQAQCRSLRKAS